MESDDENDYIPMNEVKNDNCFSNIISFFSSIYTYIKHILLNQNEENNSTNLHVLSLEEKEERNTQLEEILKRQKDSRNNSNNKTLTKEEEKEKINQTLEDMSIMGTIIKDQIIEEKITHPEKFVSIQEAATKENMDNDNPLFIMKQHGNIRDNKLYTFECFFN